MVRQKEIITRYRVSVDSELLEQDAYFLGCKKFGKCVKILDDTPAEIINANYQKVYEALSNTPMTEADWNKATAEAERIYNISMGPLDTMDYYKLVRTYYLDIFNASTTKLTKEKEKEVPKLLNDI